MPPQTAPATSNRWGRSAVNRQDCWFAALPDSPSNLSVQGAVTSSRFSHITTTLESIVSVGVRLRCVLTSSSINQEIRNDRQAPPHQSNRPVSIERGRKALKAIYYTKGRLLELARSVVKKDREKWFAARLNELRSWPERTPDEIMTAASKINPQRLMDGRWAWPKREHKIQEMLLESAPEDGINKDKLRKILANIPPDAGAKLIALLVESGLLKDSTVPLDTGLPKPKELSIKTLRRIRKADKALRKGLGEDAGEIRHAEVPRANLVSNYEQVLEFISDLDDDDSGSELKAAH